MQAVPWLIFNEAPEFAVDLHIGYTCDRIDLDVVAIGRLRKPDSWFGLSDLSLKDIRVVLNFKIRLPAVGNYELGGRVIGPNGFGADGYIGGGRDLFELGWLGAGTLARALKGGGEQDEDEDVFHVADEILM
jgi:hypothetical protein